MTTTTESRLQDPLNNVQLPFQTGHGQPGSFPTLPLPRGRNYVAPPSFTVAQTLPSIPQPPGNSRGIGFTQATTMVTSSVPASARPMSSILQSHIPSAAATPGATTLDLVSQVGDMLKQQKIDLLTEVTNIVESRLPSQPCVPKLPPSH